MQKSKLNQTLLSIVLIGGIFITLKLTGAVAWSWGWVLLPFYFLPTVTVGVFIISVFTNVFRIIIFPKLFSKKS